MLSSGAMALLSIANLELSFGDRKILNGINLTIDRGESFGMVGRNGCGKSTLMKMIMGGDKDLKPDAGHVQLSRGTRAGYLTQNPELNFQNTLLEEAKCAFERLHRLQTELERISHLLGEVQGDELDKILKQYEVVEHEIEAAGGFEVEHKIIAALHGLGLTDDMFDTQVKDLSGGQKGRLSLAKLLLSAPDILLLDEPTNHLDIAGREWLEQYLIGFIQAGGAVILISHDRWLLDRVSKKIIEIDGGKIEEYPGNYAKYRELRIERHDAKQRVYDKQQDRIKSEQHFIDRFKAGQRARQAKGREKRLERFKENDTFEMTRDQATMKLTFRAGSRSGDKVIEATAIAKRYDELTLFENFDILIKRGDRVGIIGPNGCGKTTLINCLLGKLDVSEGNCKIGASVDVGHFTQSHEGLDLNKTVVEHLQPFTKSGKEQEARNLAGAFLFSGLNQDKPLNVLSGGEKARAVLASLMVSDHNLLVLDEPSNHLDIPSAERLEAVLKEFTSDPKGYGENLPGGGTLILITHDRMFLDDIVDKIIAFDGAGAVEYFEGTYTEYLKSKGLKEAAIKPQTSTVTKTRNSKKKQKQQQKKQNKNQTKAKKQKNSAGALSQLSDAKLDDQIASLQNRLEEIDFEMSTSQVYQSKAEMIKRQDQRKAKSAELNALEEEWLQRQE